MAIFLKKHKIAYYPIPKVACTTLKDFFFRIENERKNDAGVNNNYVYPIEISGKRISVHDLYPSVTFAETHSADYYDYLKFAVVRHPVERLLSCYRSRVVRYKELSSSYIEQHCPELPAKPDPTFEEFVYNLDVYRRIHTIKHHTDPIVDWLGHDPNFYEKIYKFHELAEFAKLVNEMTGSDAKLNHLQLAQSEQPQVNQGLRAAIERIYKLDFEIYGSVFNS